MQVSLPIKDDFKMKFPYIPLLAECIRQRKVPYGMDWAKATNSFDVECCAEVVVQAKLTDDAKEKVIQLLYLKQRSFCRSKSTVTDDNVQVNYSCCDIDWKKQLEELVKQKEEERELDAYMSSSIEEDDTNNDNSSDNEEITRLKETIKNLLEENKELREGLVRDDNGNLVTSTGRAKADMLSHLLLFELEEYDKTTRNAIEKVISYYSNINANSVRHYLKPSIRTGYQLPDNASEIMKYINIIISYNKKLIKEKTPTLHKDGY